MLVATALATYSPEDATAASAAIEAAAAKDAVSKKAA